MNSRVLLFIFLSLLFFLVWSSVGWAQSLREESEQTAQHLVALLNVGRFIVERNQILMPKLVENLLRDHAAVQ